MTLRVVIPRLALALLLGAAPVYATAAPGDAPAGDSATEQASFENFIHQFRATALAAGIAPDVYDRATSGISFNPKIEEMNEKQPEFVRPVWDYLATVITPQRIARGRELIEEHATLFHRLREKYGVPPQILTAIWGIETGYGRNTGSFNLIEALANLAFEGPRTDYGRRELLAALQMAQQQHIDPVGMTGSWAGAFGQTQFIPSTFLKYAVDENGNGKVDLWTSIPDALASTANYLEQSGWQTGESWGEEV